MGDRIVLIHRGRVVLKGPVKEVRRQFGGNTVEVSGTGAFDHLPQVHQAQHVNGTWRLTLAEGTSPQALLREIAGREEMAVEHFSIALPSLHEIFIRIVGQDPTS
jgi:ABC-2 type transport system ATP-binding protein